MKSRICWCNRAMLKKDLTRNLPGGLLLAFVVSMFVWGMNEAKVQDFPVEPVLILGAVAELTGYLMSITLFGYLTKRNECDAMHALPLRRETLFFTHCIAGVLLTFLPFVVAYIILPGSEGWLFQMTVTVCQWLFAFGLMTFAMMLTARKLGGLILCSVIYNLPDSILSAVNCLYIPLLPGLYLESSLGMETDSMSSIFYSVQLGEGEYASVMLPRAALAALLGVAFLAASLVLYRRRKLERAGDFLAVKWLEPVLAWGIGISVACTLVSIGYLMDSTVWLPLIIGLTVGYFGARMLFVRSVKVFDKKILAGFGALVAVLAGSMYVVSLDPMGLVSRVPEANRIESVTLKDSDFLYSMEHSGSGYCTSDPEQVEQIRQFHKALILQSDQEQGGIWDIINYEQCFLTYTLKDGRQIKRVYRVQEEHLQKQAAWLLSQPENLVGTADLEELLDNLLDLSAMGVNGGTIHTERAFLEVFLEDCRAGHMYTFDSDVSSWSVYLDINVDGVPRYCLIDVPWEAENTIAWLEEYFSKQE